MHRLQLRTSKLAPVNMTAYASHMLPTYERMHCQISTQHRYASSMSVPSISLLVLACILRMTLLLAAKLGRRQ